MGTVSRDRRGTTQELIIPVWNETLGHSLGIVGCARRRSAAELSGLSSPPCWGRFFGKLASCRAGVPCCELRPDGCAAKSISGSAIRCLPSIFIA
jgi:hypothetical protein